jgi:hypothetical protein
VSGEAHVNITIHRHMGACSPSPNGQWLWGSCDGQRLWGACGPSPNGCGDPAAGGANGCGDPAAGGANGCGDPAAGGANGCGDPAAGRAYSFLTAGFAAGLAQSCLATE